MPTSTPTKFTASYEVEDSAKGTLTGNGQTGVSSVEIQADSGTSVNVTAVAAEGFVFYKWSDGVTTATRYDNITKDISVKAMFNDARVELTLEPDCQCRGQAGQQGLRRRERPVVHQR